MNLVERFKNREIAVNCQTEEQAKAFIKWCFDNGITWSCGDVHKIYYDRYCENTCYRIYTDGYLVYSGITYYTNEDIDVIPYEAFKRELGFTINDLKAGMIVEFRNHYKYLVLETLDGRKFLTDDGNYIYLDSFNDDLTYKYYNPSYDIMVVYGLNDVCSIDDIMDSDSYFEPIWKRHETKEMTLDEVNQILLDKVGYKVKIKE